MPSTINHIAVIMDGNRRWAEKNDVHILNGYEKGVESAKTLLSNCMKHNIKYATLYTFSIENWQRDAYLVAMLMSLLDSTLQQNDYIAKNNINLKFIGQRFMLPDSVQNTIATLEQETKLNDGLFVSLALSYGSRQEIVNATKEILKKNIEPEELTEDLFASFLYTKGYPNPDLLIRTSGEQRISNFLLWQISYTEIYFCDTLWPDFSNTDFEDAIENFYSRNSRHGK